MLFVDNLIVVTSCKYILKCNSILPLELKGIELTLNPRRCEYEDLSEGDIFSISCGYGKEEFYVMHISNGYLAAVSLHDGNRLHMKGTATVTLYDKKFVGCGIVK